jgi:thymidylate synthase
VSSVDRKYADLIAAVRRDGKRVNPRNGERIRLHEPDKIRFRSTPLVSVRKTSWRSAIREMEWFMSGSSDVADLHPSVRKWWEPWAGADGRVLNNYSRQFRRYNSPAAVGGGFDQVAAFIDGIRRKPHSSRHRMTTWHPEEMYDPETRITNCHGTKIQAYVVGGVLDLSMDQGSCDLVCGVPHNWIQYWAFLLWLCHRTGNRPGEFVWDGGDVHLYAAHLDVADRIVRRVELAGDDALPKTPELVYTPTSDEFLASDFALSGPYTPLITEAVEMVV